MFELFPTAPPQHSFPCPFLADVFDKQLQSVGKRLLGILKRVSMGSPIKRRRVANKRLPLLEVDHRDVRFDRGSLHHRSFTGLGSNMPVIVRARLPAFIKNRNPFLKTKKWVYCP